MRIGNGCNESGRRSGEALGMISGGIYMLLVGVCLLLLVSLGFHELELRPTQGGPLLVPEHAELVKALVAAGVVLGTVSIFLGLMLLGVSSVERKTCYKVRRIKR
jgi:hypothetical protein